MLSLKKCPVIRGNATCTSSYTSTFTENNNGPLLQFPLPPTPKPSTPPHLFVKRSAQRRVLIFPCCPPPPPLSRPTSPTPQSSPTLHRNARKFNQRKVSGSWRPLKPRHCLQKVSQHYRRFICKTVRGVAHYSPSRVSLGVFCVAD